MWCGVHGQLPTGSAHETALNTKERKKTNKRKNANKKAETIYLEISKEAETCDQRRRYKKTNKLYNLQKLEKKEEEGKHKKNI